MADNDIIDFYKKADTDNKPEEPLKEQVETPEPVVSEAVAVPVPESNDPFDKFLFNLAEKLKTEKKITEQQQQQFNERVVQPTTNPEDPFAKFLESFAGLVKEDENINKEENIKEATIDFINKLKNDDFFDRDVPKVVPKVKQVKSKSKKYLPPKFAKKVEKVEEEQPVIEQSTESEQEVKQPEPSNPYLKELQTADKKKNKIEDKISGLSDIKKIIAQQVQEQLSKYPNLGFTGGGGGTNAVQYAEGGTMNGNLTVNGTVNATTYLSGGTNLLNILSSSGGGGGGYADRFVSGPSQFILDPDGKLHPLDTDLLTLQSENASLSAFTRIVLSPYGFFAYDNNSNSITFDSVTDDIVITSQDLYEWTFNSEGKLVGPSGTLAVSGNIVTNSLSAFSLSANSVTASIFYGVDGATNEYAGGKGGYIILNGRDGSAGEVPGGDAGYINTSGGFGSTSPGGYINTAGGINEHTPGGNIDTSSGGGSINTSNYGGSIDTSSGGGSINTSNYGGSIDMSATDPTKRGGNINTTGTAFGSGGSINTSSRGGSINTSGGKSPGGSIKINAGADTVSYSGGTGGNIILTGGGAGNVNGGNAGSINLAGSNSNTDQGSNGGSIISRGGQELNGYGGTLDMSGGFDVPGGSITTSAGGGNIDTRNTGSIELGANGTRTTFTGTATQNRNINLPNASGTVALQSYVGSNFFPLSGGTITGPTVINNNLTVNGNLTATGTTTFANTIFSVTSALSVVHVGAGPAVWVGNNGTGDIASFYDIDQNIEVLHVGGVNSTFPNVGVKVSNPNKDFTVNGEISASSTIYASSYLSAGVNLLDIFSGGGSGGGATPIKRFDYVTVANVDISYSGTAPFGTADNNPIWKLIRLTYANNGTISNSASALNSWTGRLTATYV